jgi:ribosomal RNA methyltransferase Nop2
MQNQGVLVATDINRQRVRALRSNVSRLRVKNTLIMRMDAANLPKQGMTFDSVLIDAPCTGEGLIPLDPSRKQSRTLKDIETLTKVQQKLIQVGVKLLRKGGIMVYSTCSFAPEENEQIINFALQKFPIRVINTGLPLGDPGFITPFGQVVDPSLHLARRFFPYKHYMEGFFICKLEKIHS